MLPERRSPRRLISAGVESHALWIAALPCLALTAACGGPLPGPAPLSGGTTSIDGFDGFGGTGGSATDGPGFGGASGGGGIGTGAFGSCETADVRSVDLRAHYFDPWMPEGRVLYTWTTAEDEAALRDGAPLLPDAEAGELWEHSVYQLTAWALGHPDSIEASVAPYFATWRTAWPHPWPIRVGVEGQDPGNRLVRIELAEDAWIAKVAEHGAIWQVYDLQGREVPLDDAKAAPERVALLYYVYLGEGASELCGPIDRQVPGTGYRQLVLGNPNMVLSYEMGTERLLAELEWNIEALYGYLETIRPCPPPLLEPFEASVICSWGNHLDPFLDALASAGPAYRPTPTYVADLIELMEDSLLELDPFVAQGSTNP